MPTYEIAWVPSALKEWRQLDSTVREQFRKKLEAISHNPHIASARLSGGRHRYRIKLRKAGYRLGYQVFDDRVVVVVVGIGKRDGDEIYQRLSTRWLGRDD